MYCSILQMSSFKVEKSSSNMVWPPQAVAPRTLVTVAKHSLAGSFASVGSSTIGTSVADKNCTKREILDSNAQHYCFCMYPLTCLFVFTNKYFLFPSYIHIHTYIPLTLYPRRGSSLRYSSETPPFYQI
jgi:hypothetical protein